MQKKYLWNVGKLKLYNQSIPRETIAREREALYLSKSLAEKWAEMMALIDLSFALNGYKPIKQPQGKGIILRKTNL